MKRIMMSMWFLILALSAEAATVRGKVVRRSPAGTYPAAGVAVTVYSPGRGRTAPVFTDRYGFYILYDIPPGVYDLEFSVGKRLKTKQRIQLPPLKRYEIPLVAIP